MGIKAYLQKLKEDYVIKQVARVNLPRFKPTESVREHYVFSGKVQGVGFRLTTYQMAQRLGLTGWVENRENGEVEAEIQGEQAKIDFLVKFLNSLTRVTITDLKVSKLPLVATEREFRELGDE